MRLALALTLGLVLGSATLEAQTVPAAPALDLGATEWMATVGPALGVALFNSSQGHRYFLQALSWGRILSRSLGSGWLSGQFEWAVEVVPVFGQYAPHHTYGFGITPIVWRWNFTPRGRLAPFAELAGGGLWTRDPVPADTTTTNFTAHAAYGVRYFVKPRMSLVASYRLHHISNGNRLASNPGVNAHVLQFGMSVLRH
jgi:hypothetical protein